MHYLKLDLVKGALQQEMTTHERNSNILLMIIFSMMQNEKKITILQENV